MTKTIATMPINYTYNAERKGAHYLVDGRTNYVNGGEFAEIVCKAIRGFEAVKDANTKFDKGSDIEETKHQSSRTVADLQMKNSQTTKKIFSQSISAEHTQQMLIM